MFCPTSAMSGGYSLKQLRYPLIFSSCSCMLLSSSSVVTMIAAISPSFMVVCFFCLIHIDHQAIGLHLVDCGWLDYLLLIEIGLSLMIEHFGEVPVVFVVCFNGQVLLFQIYLYLLSYSEKPG